MLAEIRGCVEAAAREKKTLVASLAASAVVVARKTKRSKRIDIQG